MPRSITPTADVEITVSDNARIYVADTDAGYVQQTFEIGTGSTVMTMTPDQARQAARELVASADRMDAQGDARFQWNDDDLRN